MKISENKFTFAVNASKKGQIQKAKDLFQELTKQQPNRYSCWINLGTLNLQSGNVDNAIYNFNQAIEIDCFHHAAHYNRFLCWYEKKNYSQALSDLLCSLSCLYCLEGRKQQKLAYLDSALSLVPNNFKAYLYKAEIYEIQNNLIEAENNYTKAIVNSPNCVQNYTKRAQFYRRINKQKQSQNDIINMLKIQNTKVDKYSLQPKLKKIENENIIDRITQLIKQFIKLTDKNLKNNLNKMQQISIDIKSNNSRLLNNKSIYNNNSSQYFQQDQSKFLNQEIKKLQQQIIQGGGKLQTSKLSNQKDKNQNQDHFLSVEIQKAIQQLENIQETQNILSNNQIEQNINNKSKKQININEYQKYKNYSIEIISAEIINDNFNQKFKQYFITLQYDGLIFNTKSTNLKWNQIFTGKLNSKNSKILVKIYGKGTIWKPDTCFGQGVINLLNKSTTRCILTNQSRKSGIVYYKLILQQ